MGEIITALEITCPNCNNTTFAKEGMTNVYCIVCGSRIAVDNGRSSTCINGDKKRGYEVTFHYERSLMSEFDTGCKITIDDKLFGVASDNADKTFVLSPGTHEVVFQVHVSAGVNSTDVTTSFNLEIDSNKYYVVRGKGTFHRKIEVQEH